MRARGRMGELGPRLSVELNINLINRNHEYSAPLLYVLMVFAHVSRKKRRKVRGGPGLRGEKAGEGRRVREP